MFQRKVNEPFVITNSSDIYHKNYGPKEKSMLPFLRLPFNLNSEYVTGKSNKMERMKLNGTHENYGLL